MIITDLRAVPAIPLPRDEWVAVCEPSKVDVDGFDVTLWPATHQSWGIHDLNTATVADTEKSPIATTGAVSLAVTAKLWFGLKSRCAGQSWTERLKGFPLTFVEHSVVGLTVDEFLELRRIFAAS